MTALAQYHAARAAIAAAMGVNEAAAIRDEMEHVKLYARQVKDKELLADATEIQLRAERRLGELLLAAERAGQLQRQGRPRKALQEKPSRLEGFSSATLAEIGVDYKTSAKTKKTAALAEDAFEAIVHATRERIASGNAIIIAPEPDSEADIIQAAARIRAEKAEKRRNERLRRVIVNSDLSGELPKGRRFPLAYIDPPWRYENPHMGTTGRSIENHYPTMALEDICALPVGDLLLPDAVAFIWTTVPHTYCSVPAVLAAWGITFRSEIAWDKEVMAYGYWTRGQHEKLLICTRGDIPCPHGESCPPSVYRERRGAHSVKPDRFYEIIEGMFPQFLRLPPDEPLMIELFARRARRGWARWGNQAPADDAPAAASNEEERIGA